jgi:hypothetical protein
MDSSSDLPPIFKKHGYFLLPVKNGQYAIVRGNGFHKLERMSAAGIHRSRIKFLLTTAGRGSSEMQYLDYSFNSGALESVLGLSPLYQSIRGREFSKSFNFKVNKSVLDVSSVQLEVDSGLEGEDSIVLVEAKMKTPDDFMIRQLFYPFNHYKIVAPGKKLVPVFFTYEASHKTYNFWIYEIPDPRDYNSIRLKEVKSLVITTQSEIELQDIRPKGVVLYGRQIPQANDVKTIIELVFKVHEGINNHIDVAEYFDFDKRQSSYYREAAEVLGLVVSEKGEYRLTEIGTQLVQLPAENRNLFIAQLLADFDLIKAALDQLGDKKELSQNDIELIIAKKSNLTGTTIPRRAASLKSWLRWMSHATGSFVATKSGFELP